MKQLYQIAENENINVIERNIPDSFNGFFYRNGKFNLICLKRKLRKVYKRITFAHELGHYYTSSGNALFQDRDFFNTCSQNEYLARKWAAEYLIPKEQLIMYLNHLDGDYINEYELADIFNVTPEFVMFRVNILNNK
jgi:Zn-dependent peptidase ImmA (M78 family)